MIRKIFLKFKNLLNIPYSKPDHDYLFLRQIKNTTFFHEIRREGNEVSFRYGNINRVYARLLPHSDGSVVEQVLTRQEYRTAVDYFKDNFDRQEEITLIDAGANVGYSSLYFLNQFSKITIACVEPDNQNLAMLKKNLQSYINKGSVKVFQNGLMGESNKNIIVQNDFRDGKDWSKTVSVTNEISDLKSITVPQIMDQMKWNNVDVLKMDIEGAERFVFNDQLNLDWLKQVRLLALEIHDEFNIRHGIYHLLRANDFILMNAGETTFGINKRYITA